MKGEVIHALVSLQNWGDNSEILQLLKNDKYTVSIFHIMGRYSYIIDANFDDKEQLSAWICSLKSVKMQSGIPVVLQMQTQRIIDVHKQKDAFSLNDYIRIKEKFHFFVKIDNPHHDSELIELLKKSAIVYSILHVQGENSFTIEVIADEYDKFKALLKGMKQIGTIHHIETQEVISVIKYRNSLIGADGKLTVPDIDIREMYTL